jgi:hypothetical protein
VIEAPLNDRACLGAVSKIALDLIRAADPVVTATAQRFDSFDGFVEWLRALPQYDDLGNPAERPRVAACVPTQRLRLDSTAPNCFERAALALAVGEIKLPASHWRLATTTDGTHTFLVKDGEPVILDPLTPEGSVTGALVLSAPGATGISPDDAIQWATDIASAGAPRNGRAIRNARSALHRLTVHAEIPTAAEIETIARVLALAAHASRRYGPRALAMVRTVSRAVSDVIDTVAQQRNAAIELGGFRLDVPDWFARTASAAGETGLDIGALLAREKLAQLGIGSDMVGLAESNFEQQGLSLGKFAHPPDLPTFATFATPRKAGQ